MVLCLSMVSYWVYHHLKYFKSNFTIPSKYVSFFLLVWVCILSFLLPSSWNFSSWVHLTHCCHWQYFSWAASTSLSANQKWSMTVLWSFKVLTRKWGQPVNKWGYVSQLEAKLKEGGNQLSPQYRSRKATEVSWPASWERKMHHVTRSKSSCGDKAQTRLLWYGAAY